MERALRVLAVGDPAVYGYKDPRYSIVETFNRVRDAIVLVDIIPWKDYYETMMSAFEGNKDYDVVMVAGHLWLKDFVHKGYLSEVTPYNPSKYDSSDIIEVISNEMRLDDKHYLYPSFCDGHILLYRKSIVEKVSGGKLPSVVNTETISSLARKCHGYEGMAGIALKAHPSEIFLDFLPYLRSEGVDAFNHQTLLPTFHNEQGVRALEKYVSLKAFAPENTHTFGNDEVREAFQQKKSIMSVTWGGQLGFVMDERCIEKEDVGFAAIDTAWNVTWSFAINDRSSKKELANEFLSYLTSSEIDQMIGSYAGAPVRKSSYLADKDNISWYPIHLDLIEKYAKPLPMMDLTGEKLAPLYEQIYAAFIGKVSPADALEIAEKNVLEICRRTQL